MFTIQFGRIFWKEYRSQRTLWLSCLGFGILWIVGSILWKFERQTLVSNLVFAPSLFAILYALGGGAILFASERESRTSNWLLCLSAAPKATLAAKTAFTVVATFGVQLILIFVTLTIRGGLTLAESNQYPLNFIGFAGLWVLIWSILGSLLSRRVLVAIGVMAASWTLLIWLPMIAIYTLFNLWNRNGPELDNRLSMSIFSLSTLLAIIADGVLGWRWCQGKYVDGTVVEDFCKRLEGWFGERTGVVRRSARVPKHAEYDQPWRRTWQRLVWQERHRESIHLALLVACCAIGAILIIADSMGNYGLAFLVILLCAAIPAAMGVLAFESDDDHQQLRFLASRGVSPISLWLAKQVVWLPRAFWITSVVFFVSLIVAWIFNSDKHAPEMRVQSFFLYAVERWDLIVWYVLLGYGSGQLTSIVFRRAILAGVFGFALNLFVLYWVILLVDRSSPLVHWPHWWFLGFPVVSMFLFTLWQMNPRMFEVYSWRRYVQMVAAIGIVPLFLYIGILVNLTVDVFVFKSLGFR